MNIIQKLGNCSIKQIRKIIAYSVNKTKETMIILGKPSLAKDEKQFSQLYEHNCYYVLRSHILEQEMSKYMTYFYSQTQFLIKESKQADQNKINKFLKYPDIFTQQSLFQKYSQSQNYYYTRDINEIISDTVSKGSVRFKDYLTMDEEDEFLKRYYQREEYPQKIVLLAEYYKFHTDIPRLFMEPTCAILNKYFDKKRKFQYYKIARLIEEENKNNPNRPPKGIVGEKPSPINSLEADDDDETQQNKQVLAKDTQILKDLSFLNKTIHQNTQQSRVDIKIAQKKKKVDHSQTLQEICRNLESQVDSRNNQDQSGTSLFQVQLHQIELQKLNNFIMYVKKCQQYNHQQPQSRNEEIENKKIKRGSQYQGAEQIKTESMKSLSIEKQSSTRQNSTHFDQAKAQKVMINELKQMKQNLKQRVGVLKQKDSKNSSKKNTPVMRSFEQELQEIAILNNIRKAQIGQQQDKQVSPKTIPKMMQKPQNKNNFQKQNDLQQKLFLKLNNLQTIHNEEEQQEAELLLKKSGAQTHRPQTNTQNYFNCNKHQNNQQQLQQQQQQPIQKKEKKNMPEIKKLSLGNLDQFQNIQQPLSNRSHQSQKQQNFINNGAQTARPCSKNTHSRKASERVINININIHENQNKAYIQQLIKKSEAKHKKINSEGKPIYLKDQYLSPKDMQLQNNFLKKNINFETSEHSGSQSDRNSYGKMIDFLFQKNQNSQSSPKENKKIQFPQQKNIYLQPQANPYLRKVTNQQSSGSINLNNSPSFTNRKSNDLKQQKIKDWAIEQVKHKQQFKEGSKKLVGKRQK